MKRTMLEQIAEPLPKAKTELADLRNTIATQRQLLQDMVDGYHANPITDNLWRACVRAEMYLGTGHPDPF